MSRTETFAKYGVRIICFLLVFLLSCQGEQHRWPSYVRESLFVPDGASGVRYYRLYGSYQVEYRVNECHPCRQFIEAMVRWMTKNEWRRLEYNYLNPRIKSNHAKAPGGIWDHFIDEHGKSVYQWLEDWEDAKGDVVTYGLRYRANFGAEENRCVLEVVVIYIPAEIARQSNNN